MNLIFLNVRYCNALILISQFKNENFGVQCNNKMTFDSDSSETEELKMPMITQFTSDDYGVVCYDEKGEEIVNIYFDQRVKCCENSWHEIRMLDSNKNDANGSLSFDDLGDELVGKTIMSCSHNLKEDSHGDINKASFKIEAISTGGCDSGTVYEFIVTLCNEHNGYYSHEYKVRVGTFNDYGAL